MGISPLQICAAVLVVMGVSTLLNYPVHESQESAELRRYMYSDLRLLLGSGSHHVNNASLRENRSSGFPTSFYTDRAVQPQNIVIGLKFRI